MKQGRWIKTNGTEEIVVPANSKSFTLDELQKYVGGYIELVKTRRPVRTMYVNEEGMLLNLPLNSRATALISQDYLLLDGVRGDVVVIETVK